MPAPPAVLMPVRLDTGERRRTAIPFGPDTARPAAVLVLVTPDSDTPDAEAEIVLIRRTDHGGPHGGDVALPGGRVEPADRGPAAAALREAAEEVALDPVSASVRVVGELETFWIPVSDYRVTPVVAIASRRPVLFPSPSEVAGIVRVPLDTFLPGAPIEIVETTIQGFPLRFGAYPASGLRVWGATARILGQLGAVIGAGDAPR
jgi:8-oxo-dGTP pyrophosphatase MutT (NUDIX family)